MIRRLKRLYWTLHYKYVVSKATQKQENGFGLNNTFILPSSFGWVVLFVAICLFVLGTNYQNNVVLTLSYLLLAIHLLSMFHSFSFFTQFKLVLLPLSPDYENRKQYIDIEVHSDQRYAGGILQITLEKQKFFFPLDISASNNERGQQIRIPLPPLGRGVHYIPQLKVSASFGYGLYTCWSYAVHPEHMVVYPSVQKSKAILHQTSEQEDGNLHSDSQLVVSDNLQGIRPFQITDPLYHVSWKHAAKGQGLLTKDFNENSGLSGWLKISDYSGFPVEERLRILCFQVQELGRDKVKFGLDLGNTKILPSVGSQHINNCLFALAKFDPDESSSFTKSIG